MKKQTSIFLFLFLFLSLTLNTNNVHAQNPEESSDSITMITEDLVTGESGTLEIEASSDSTVLDAKAYSPENENNNSFSTFAIIGADERYRVPDMLMNSFPYKAIGVVVVEYYDGSRAHGMGFLYSPNDVATAGHVLSNDNNSIECYFLFRC